MGHVEVSRYASFGHDVRIEVFGEKGQVVSNNKRATEAEVWNNDGTQLDCLLPTFKVNQFSKVYYSTKSYIITLFM